MINLYVKNFSNWNSTQDLLEKSDILENIPNDKTIILKPNVVQDLKPPITTPFEFVEEIIVFLQKNVSNKIIIAEGAGDPSYTTFYPFETLGYTKLAEKYNIELIDLNEEELVLLKNDSAVKYKEMYLPKIVMDNYIISIPVLKAHSLAKVTLTMKNMMGAVPPKHYCAGTWQKSDFHSDMQNSVLDLNRYRTPDYTIMDATIGMAEAHLWGPTCNPPVNKIIACKDSVAIDVYGTTLLNFDWESIGHIKDADGVIGSSEFNEIIL